MELLTNKINKNKRVLCNDCKRETNHKIITAYKRTGYYEPADITYWSEYYIFECLGCNRICFSIFSGHDGGYPEDVGIDFNDYTEKEFFPPREFSKSLMDNDKFIPSKVLNIYKETYKAINNCMNILAGIGIRAIVEAVCMHKNITSGNLKTKINELKNKGLVTESGVEILHHLRFLGNAAAHEIELHSKIDLQTGFEVAENLLMNVYVIPKKAKVLKAKFDQNN